MSVPKFVILSEGGEERGGGRRRPKSAPKKFFPVLGRGKAKSGGRAGVGAGPSRYTNKISV